MLVFIPKVLSNMNMPAKSLRLSWRSKRLTFYPILEEGGMSDIAILGITTVILGITTIVISYRVNQLADRVKRLEDSELSVQTDA